MFYQFIIVAFASAGIVLSVAVAPTFLRSRFGLFHPVVLLLALSTLDVFLPAILWSVTDDMRVPSWAAPLSWEDLTTGLCFYMMAYVLLVLGFVVCGTTGEGQSTPRPVSVRGGPFWFLLLGLLLLGGLQFWSQIKQYGSLGSWFIRMAAMRYEPWLHEKAGPMWAQLVSYIPSQQLFVVLVYAGFFHRYELRRPFVLGVVMPGVATCLSLATFCRGTILLLVIGFGFLEYMRVRGIKIEHGKRPRRPMIIQRTLTRYLLVGTILFMLYGVVRETLYTKVWNTNETITAGGYVYDVFAQGAGLIGVSAVVQKYREEVPLLAGKTYFDMLLLPVPRVIYTSKPEWYGVSDITRGMGWPKTMQAAVTIPGEAFANFGWLGLFCLPVAGMVFGLLYRLCSGQYTGLLFLYPGVVLNIIFVSNWMSSNGFMGQFVPLVFAIVILRMIFGARRDYLTEGIGNGEAAVPFPQHQQPTFLPLF